MSRRTFSQLIARAKESFEEHGYGSAEIEVHITPADAIGIQHEPDVADLIVDTALHPTNAPARQGMRLFAIVHDIRVYVKEP